MLPSMPLGPDSDFREKDFINRNSTCI